MKWGRRNQPHQFLSIFHSTMTSTTTTTTSIMLAANEDSTTAPMHVVSTNGNSDRTVITQPLRDQWRKNDNVNDSVGAIPTTGTSYDYDVEVGSGQRHSTLNLRYPAWLFRLHHSLYHIMEVMSLPTVRYHNIIETILSHRNSDCSNALCNAHVSSALSRMTDTRGSPSPAKSTHLQPLAATGTLSTPTHPHYRTYHRPQSIPYHIILS